MVVLENTVGVCEGVPTFHRLHTRSLEASGLLPQLLLPQRTLGDGERRKLRDRAIRLLVLVQLQCNGLTPRIALLLDKG